MREALLVSGGHKGRPIGAKQDTARSNCGKDGYRLHTSDDDARSLNIPRHR